VPPAPSSPRVGAAAQPPVMTELLPPEPPASFLPGPESAGGGGVEPSGPASRSPTQVFVAVWHTGVGVVQSELVTHCTHEPAEQALPEELPAQSPSFLQPMQVFPEPQTGVGFAHWVLVSHWHVSVSVLQLEDAQSESCKHPTHAPVLVSQTPPPQASLDLQALQVSESTSQTGVSPAQSMSATHATHWKLSVLQ
jgi:hypothetical protein